MARHGEVHWSDPDPVITTGDGQFDISFVPPPPYQHFLDVRCADRAPRTARWGAFQPGQIEDLGDVALALGHAVEGRVVDASAAPVPGVFVSIEGLPLPVRGEMGANDSRVGKSDEAGNFRVDAPIPPGTWSIDAQARGVKLVSPDNVTVPDSGAMPPLTVVVRRMPSISGVVVDETGAGVGRVTLKAELRKSAGRMASAHTQADGSFTIYAVDDALEPVRLTTLDAGPCEPMKEPTPPVPWGTTDVRIELVRALSFELTVVERKSGEPVEEFSVACFPDRSTSSRQRDDRLGGRHAGGKLTVDGVWHGPNRLTVHPNDPDLLANEPIAFDATAAPLAPIRVELERATKRFVRVVSAAHEPIAGSRVELVRIGSQPFDAASLVIDVKHGARAFGGKDFRPHELVEASVTDEHGLATLRVPPVSAELGVRATGTHHVARALAPVHFSEDGSPLEIVVASGGRIAGKLGLQGYVPGTVFLEFVLEGSNGLFRPPRVEVRSDGSFETPSLEPGVWLLYLSIDHEFQGGGGSLRLEPELARVPVAEDESARVDLDGRSFAAAEVAGTILIDETPLPAFRAFLMWKTSHQMERFGPYVPDAQGRFEAKGLPPGTWNAGIFVGDFKASDGDRIGSGEWFTLSPAQNLRRDFVFERHHLVLRVLQADGVTPLASVEVQVRQTLTFEVVRRTTDPQGRLVLDPAPAGEFRLFAAGLQTDALRMPEDRKEAELDAVLRNP